MNLSSDTKIFLGVGLATLILIVGAIFFFGQSGSTTSSSNPSRSVHVDQNILVHDDSWSEGPKDAKVTLVEFGDFQCPACKNTEGATEEIRTKYQGKIRFVWRNFPLTQVHEFAFTSAEAAEAAGLQNKFWDYHKKLYELSPDLGTDKLISAAKDLGLDVEKFKKDIDSDPVRQRVLNDQADGNKAGVDGTPTYFINSNKLVLDHLPTAADFSAIIDPLLK